VPPRLLIVADPKMLPALSGGLREGARFDVQAVALADAAAAQAAAETVDAVAIFYGAPTSPLPAALQALAPKVRERGARLLGVLQREQAAHRDECFRAGASDVLFMPAPKEQFVARLAASVELSFSSGGGGPPSTVFVATRSVSSRFERATISALGVEAPSQLALKPGDTVRLSFASFQSWGLVVRGAPAAQIRFAGLSPEEEKRITDWVKSGSRPQPAAPQRPQPAPAAAVQAPPPPATPRARPASPAPAGHANVQPAAARPSLNAGRAAPTVGPPPGFAERKAPHATSRPIATPESGAPRPGPHSRSPSNGQEGPLAGLFDKADGTPAAAPVPEPAPAPKGPPWPARVQIDLCKEAAMALLGDQAPGPEVPANIVSSARKIAALLSVSERASIEKTGRGSHFADALAARIALDAATAEGNRLGSAKILPTVDAAALAALTRAADEAAARLQQEANAAIGKGEVESLQLVTAASASLSRDLLNLKETADRLRGLATAPRLGAGGLDPDVVLPGQQPRPRAAATPQAQAPVRAELRDFRGLEEKPGRGKVVAATVFIVAAIAVGAHAFYFSVPRHAQIAVEAAGRGVQRIDVTGSSAVVTVTPEWLAEADTNVPKLLHLLKSKEVSKALLTLPTGKAAGLIDVESGRASGLPPPKPPPSPAVQLP
jgi:DNA-binding response OmpR family regulator